MFRTLATLGLFATLIALCFSPFSKSSLSVAVQDDPAPPKIALQPVLVGLQQPLFVTGARDGSERLFIVERPGQVRVLAPGASSPTLFLDITEKVLLGGERGLLGLAFHPDHENNRRFFVCYSSKPDGATVIAEYRVSESDPNLVEPEETLVLVIPQPEDIHHGGTIEFGLDNFLYISTGDGAWEDPEQAAQDIESLRGKILRIDVDQPNGDQPYSSPSTNPFFGDVPGRDEVFAYGFRNPWRFSFDRVTEGLYVADVGHDEREEVNLVTSGGNYGWRVFEGTRCTGFDPDECNSLESTAPFIEYDHSLDRCSVTGGYVYRGSQSSLPSGAYVFGDFCSGEIFLFVDGVLHVALESRMRIASFGEDDNGEIYVVNIRGEVHRLQLEDELPQVGIESVQLFHRPSGTVRETIKVEKNGRKFELIVRGFGFEPKASVYVDGRKMKTRAGDPPDEVRIARLKHGTLQQAGTLTVEVVKQGGIRSAGFQIQVE